MSHALVPLADAEEWSAALQTVRHAHAHTHDHVAAFHASSGDDTFLFVERDDTGRTLVACPVAVRGEPGARDAYTPFGFGGFAADADRPELAATWDAVAAASAWVASYVFQNPLLEADLGFSSEHMRDAGPCYWLDLTRPRDEQLQRMSARRRAEIRRWEETGAELTSDREEILGFLRDHADQFFDARGAAGVYRLSPRTWALLVAAPTVWCIGVREAGTVVAAAVFGTACGMVDYLFGISRPGGPTYSAPLVWEAVRRFSAIGASTLNLGGGIRPGDGVAEFKRRFGADQLPFRSARFVHRPDRYAELCRCAGVDADPAGFFPPYRRPR